MKFSPRSLINDLMLRLDCRAKTITVLRAELHSERAKVEQLCGDVKAISADFTTERAAHEQTRLECTQLQAELTAELKAHEQTRAELQRLRDAIAKVRDSDNVFAIDVYEELDALLGEGDST